MKAWLILLLVSLLAACSSANEPTKTQSPKLNPFGAVELPDFGVAPELTNDVWLNTDQPLRLADLRGQVILLDMWTFG